MKTPAMKHGNRGFTLIEVMITIAIIAFLASIAIPNYSAYMQRAHRAEARAGLLAAQQWLERAATATGVYPTSLPSALTTLDSGRYVIDFDDDNSNATYTLTATPKGAQVGDECGTFTLTNTSERGSDGTMAKCW